jgi:hypothetical protein
MNHKIHVQSAEAKYAKLSFSYFSCAITLHTWAARVWQGAYQPPQAVNLIISHHHS